MNLDFKELETFLQDYINDQMSDDLKEVTAAQRLGFIEKYLEFIEPKQLRRGTKQATGDMNFTLIEHPIIEESAKNPEPDAKGN